MFPVDSLLAVKLVLNDDIGPDENRDYRYLNWNHIPLCKTFWCINIPFIHLQSNLFNLTSDNVMESQNCLIK